MRWLATACTLPDGGCTTADTSWQEPSSQNFLHELSWPIAQRVQDLAYVGMTVGRFFTHLRFGDYGFAAQC